MKLSSLTIEDLFKKSKKLTFLVGAGCSVDAPSCLPNGHTMMEAIINYSCAESEIKKVLKLKELRFEQLVEIIRDRLDPELNTIVYYGQCDKPNPQHFFLAEMIKQGHFVMTTNFDSLIEYALLQSGVSENKIIPVITEKDFKKYDNPDKLFKKGEKTVYKIHGSPNNIINPKKSTKDSLVATIQAFGSNKEGLNVFQVEPFKRTLFDNISNGRSLVVMGYSGSDDFDVVPTLKVLKNLRNIIWINYIHDDSGKEMIYEINSKAIDKPDKVNQILKEIKRSNNADRVYRVDANTTRLIEKMLDMEPKVSPDNFSVSPNEWLKENVKAPSQMMKHHIPYKIYRDFDVYNDAMRCSEKILRIAKKSENQFWKSTALNNIASIYYAQGNNPKALVLYKEALKIDKQLEDLSGKVIVLNNIGTIYHEQGNYPEALKKFENALKIDAPWGNLSKKASCLNNIGEIYRVKGNYSKALKKFENALKIDEQLGDLSGKAIVLNNIGMVYYEQGNYPEALKRYEEALKIDEKLGNLSGKTTRLNNIGLIYHEQGNNPEALKRYEEALKIDEQLGDLSGKATIFNNIGLIYHEQGNYPEALKRYEEVLKIDEQMGKLLEKSTTLNNIGAIYQEQGNYPEALKRYEEAMKIDEKLGNLSHKAIVLNSIASIHYAQGNYPKALDHHEKALEILTQLGLSDSPNAKTFKENIKHVKSIL